MRHQALLSEIESFLAETGMAEFTFGFRAVRNGRLVSRLRDGGRIWPETEVEVRAFIKSHRSDARRLARPGDAA